jgi:hypothetical protein
VAEAVERVDRWLLSHLNLIAALALAGGFALRLRAGLGTYLNPDEALHFVLVNQPSLVAAYKASLSNAHPPLYFVLLYFCRFLGTSEIMLRLPSMLAGAGAAWMAFRWIGAALGKTAGLFALILLAFSPTLIALGAEVRAYSVLLFWMAAALYFLERALQDRSASPLKWHAFFLYLAILTQYSALWFTIALGVYGLLRIRELPRRAAVNWAALEIGAAAIYAVLYVTHISKLHGSAMEKEASQGWLRALYFQPHGHGAVAFLIHATQDLFQFLFASSLGGKVALFLFAAGALWLIVAGTLQKKSRPLGALGVLLLLPFGLNFLASLWGAYPYGGTRHSVFLILFATAGISLIAAMVVHQKLWPVMVAAVLIVPLWNRHALPAPQQMSAREQKRDLMTGAIAYLGQRVPAGGRIFTDYQASIMLGYYLGRDEVPPPPVECAGLHETRLGGYRVTSIFVWSANAREFLDGVNRWRRACNPGEPGPAWGFDAGWGENVLDDLYRSSPHSYSEHRLFGPISVFQMALTAER